MEAGNPKGNGGSLGHVLLNQEVSGSTTKGYMGLPYEQIKLPISRRQFMYIYFISFSQLAYLFWGCLFEHINQHAWGGFWVARTKAGILFFGPVGTLRFSSRFAVENHGYSMS